MISAGHIFNLLVSFKSLSRYFRNLKKGKIMSIPQNICGKLKSKDKAMEWCVVQHVKHWLECSPQIRVGGMKSHL